MLDSPDAASAGSKGLWLGLAESTRKDADTLQTQSERRLALHVTLGALLAQILTFIGWLNPPFSVAFIIPALCGGIAGTLRLFMERDHSWLRWVNLAAGALFVLVHFVGEGCRLLERSGARYFTAILPSLVFHAWMGGDVKTQIGVCVAHFVFFVIFAIIEGSTDKPCFDTMYDPLTTSPGGVVFVFAVLPLAVTLFGLMLVYSAFRIRSSGWAFTERMAADLARYIREHNFAGARSYVAAATSGRDPQMSLCDLVMCAGVTHSAMFEEISLVPVAAAAGLDPNEIAQQPGALKELQRQMSQRSLLEGGLASSIGDSFMVGAGAGAGASTDGSTPGRDSQGLTPGRSGSSLQHDSSAKALSVTALDGAPSRDQHGGMRRRSSAYALTRSRSSVLGRSSSMRERDINPVSVTPGFMLMITLPSFPAYAHKQQSTEMLKLLLSEYFDAVSQICEAYGGTVMFCCFTDIFCMFDQCASACGAALATRALLEKEAMHHRDNPFLELNPTRTLSVVFHTSVTSATVGTKSVVKMGVCEGQVLFEVVKGRALRSSSLGLPLLLIAAKLAPLVTRAFDTGRCEIPKFHKVAAAKDINELGYPVLPDDPASPLRQHELDPPLVSEVLADEMAATGGGGGGGAAAAAAGGTAAAAAAAAAAVGGGMSFGSEGAVTNESMASQQQRARLAPEIMEVWRQYDADRSGTLELNEMRELLLDIGIEMTDEELQRFFDEVDTDKSGSISQEEFARAFDRPQLAGFQMIVTLRKKAQQMRIQNGIDNLPLVLAAWKRYDADGNGTLSASEIELVLKDLGIAFPSSEHVEWFVEKFDQNGSGTIELDEFAALFSEASGNTQLNAAKARIETVTRVLSNKSGNMTYSTPTQDEHDALIRFHAFWNEYLSLPLFLYIVYNFGSVGYELGIFEDSTTIKLIIDMLLDILYYAWFALKMLYLPRKRRGQFILDRDEIRADYQASLEFYIDVIVVIPLDIFYLALPWEIRGIHAFYRINKIFSMYHINSLMDQIFQRLAPSNQSIVISLCWYFFISHIFACFFLVTAVLFGDGPIEELSGWDATIADSSTTYLQAILWALLTLAGQVKGSPVPSLDSHVVLLFISVFVGIPLFGILLGVIGNAVTTENGEARFRRTIDALKGYFEYTELPANLEVACIDYYRHIFITTGSLEVGHNPLADLPVELSVDVTINIGSDMLKKVPIFAEATENVEFVHELTSKMFTRIIEPGLRIVKKGERGSNMYFITYGAFDIRAGPNDSLVVWVLKKGNFFGEIALLQNVKRTATIYNDKNRFANVLVLEKRDFDQVAAIFPECVSKIYQKAESRLIELREKEAQEAREAKEKQKQKERDAAGAKKAAEESGGGGGDAAAAPSAAAAAADGDDKHKKAEEEKK